MSGRWWTMRLAGSAIMLVCAASTCGCLADKVMLWPPSGPTDPNGAVRRVESGIEIWVAAPPSGTPSDAYVLRFYGNGGRAEWQVAEEASHFERTTFWGVNYRGFGGSEGSATLRGVAEAATIAYDALAREAHGKPIYAFGTSMGTTAALHLAAERDVAGLLLVNPPPLKRLVLEEHGWWNLWLIAAPTALGIPSELDSEANARRARAPAVFVTSENDEVVPLGYQGRIVAAYAGAKEVVLMPRAGHGDAPTPEVADKISRAIGWMMSQRAQARAKSSDISLVSSGETVPDSSR